MVYASFVFFYRGERGNPLFVLPCSEIDGCANWYVGQLKKMGLIKPPPPLPPLARTESDAVSSENKWKKQDFASLSSALSSLIPKSDGLLNGAKKGFTGFREDTSEWDRNGDSGERGGKFIPGIDDRDEHGELLMGDELGRDARDALRERMKSEEEVRLEEELVGRVGRIKV